MSESNQKEDKQERRFSQEQYDMLKRCSEKKDMTEWNEWREANPSEDIWLQGIEFRGRDACLKGANLRTGIGEEYKGEVHLEGAIFVEADLEGATLEDTYLGGTKFLETNLKDTILRGAIIDDGTLIWACEVSKDTDCDGVGIDRARIDPRVRQLLEYNTRRKMWEAWYKYRDWYKDCHKRCEQQSKIGKGIRYPVRWFWAMSDYGMSTGRVVGVFFLLAVLFALVYWQWPSCIVVNNVVGDIRGFVHALYFSVVTMTTLGFGDIAANPDSWGGQVLLMVQVLLGYVLLGALVTRFAVLFTAGGPAGEFAEEKGIYEKAKK